MAFGAQLRKAREEKGLTTSDVAAATRMKVQIVEDLEAEELGRIAAVIYGKGFIKLYAEYVGIEAAPLIDDYVIIAGVGVRDGKESTGKKGNTSDAITVSGGKTRFVKTGTMPSTPAPTERIAEPSEEPDLFSAAAAARKPKRIIDASGASSTASDAPRVQRVRPVSRGLAGIKLGFRKVFKGCQATATVARRKTHRLLNASRHKLLAALEAGRRSDTPLKTAGLIIGLALLFLLIISGLSRCVYTGRNEARYPIAIEMPEPYFE